MAYEIAQDYKFKGDDWWEWAIWIEASDEELDKINYVEYTLHPTFAKPVRTNKNRGTKFRLETAGWGTFTVYAKAFLKDGENVNMQHELEFKYPDEKITSDEEEVEKVSVKTKEPVASEKTEAVSTEEE